MKAFGNDIANIACTAFPATFLLGTTALEIYQPGYNRLSDTISELVWGPSGWVENALFMAFAIALSIFAFRMRATSIPLAAAALGFAIISVFPTQAPGAGPSPGSLIHQYSAQGIALALPIACFITAKNIEDNEENRFIIICSLTAGILGVFLNLAGFLAVYGETAWMGAAERLVMLNGLIWLQIVGIHLWLHGKSVSNARCENHNQKSALFDRGCHPAAQPIRVVANNDENRRPR
jgi:hypothetical protein